MSDTPENTVPFDEATKNTKVPPSTPESDMRGAFHNMRVLGSERAKNNEVSPEAVKEQLIGAYRISEMMSINRLENISGIREVPLEDSMLEAARRVNSLTTEKGLAPEDLLGLIFDVYADEEANMQVWIERGPGSKKDFRFFTPELNRQTPESVLKKQYTLRAREHMRGILQGILGDESKSAKLDEGIRKTIEDYLATWPTTNRSSSSNT